MDVREFFANIQKHCEHESDMRILPCKKCKYRDFCYTTPLRWTDELLTETMKKMGNNICE